MAGNTYTSTDVAKHVNTPTTAGQPDTVTLGVAGDLVEIVNDGAAGLYVVVARGAADSKFPTAAIRGDNTYYVPPGAVRTIADDGQVYAADGSNARTPVTKVSLISETPCSGYHVTAIRNA